MADQTPNVPQLLQLYFSPEEATLILNKLNTADFKGFGEASMAMTILGKIRGANQVPVAGVGPNTVQMDKARTAPPSSPREIKENLSGKGFRPVPKPDDFKQEVKTPPEVKEEVTTETEELESSTEQTEEDMRPTAPLRPLEESKNKEVTEEDVPPPEDAGIFSVINRSKVSGSDKDYV